MIFFIPCFANIRCLASKRSVCLDDLAATSPREISTCITRPG